MRKLYLVVAALAVLGLTGSLAVAQKPPKTPKAPKQPPANPALTLSAKPNPVVFGRSTTLSGRLSGGAQSLTVQQNRHPFTGGFVPLKTVATGSNGAYSTGVTPRVNTRYRVSTQGTPAVLSGEYLVQVQIRVSMRLSDSTPRAGSLVRFSGSVAPAHDGRVVEIQRLRRSGGYATIARTTARDAGTSRSTYARRIRVSRTGSFRVRVLGDGDHVSGFSPARTARVG